MGAAASYRRPKKRCVYTNAFLGGGMKLLPEYRPHVSQVAAPYRKAMIDRLSCGLRPQSIAFAAPLRPAPAKHSHSMQCIAIASQRSSVLKWSCGLRPQTNAAEFVAACDRTRKQPRKL